MDFKYKSWNVHVDKDSFTKYFIWTAYRSDGQMIGDKEGGWLNDMKNAKYQIKEWIDEYEKDAFSFKMRHPELMRFRAFSL